MTERPGPDVPELSAGADLLARLAARAVGRAASARPRVRSRYEAAPGAAQPWDGAVAEGFAMVENEVTASAARPIETERQGARRSAAGPARRAEADGSQATAAAEAAPWAAGSSTAPVPRPASGATLAPPAGRVPGRHPDAEPAGTGVPAVPLAEARSGARPAIRPPDDRLPAVVVARPVARPQPLAETLGRDPGATAGSPAGSVPVVQIHIGRIDVRANLEAPTEAPPPAAAEPEPGLSLADYLAGKRAER